MNRMTIRFSLFLCLSFVVSQAAAEKDASIAPKVAAAAKVAKVASPTVAVTFDGDGEISEPWQALKGEWKRVDGKLVGKELASDKHAAVFHYKKANRDSVVRFSFRFEGKTNGMHFSLNQKRGHLCRVVVSPNRMYVNLDKDKKDPASKAVMLGQAKGEFKSGQWYTMLVEMVGDRIVAQADNGATVAVQHAKLDVDKPNYRFITRGDALQIDDFRVWDMPRSE